MDRLLLPFLLLSLGCKGTSDTGEDPVDRTRVLYQWADTSGGEIVPHAYLVDLATDEPAEHIASLESPTDETWFFTDFLVTPDGERAVAAGFREDGTSARARLVTVELSPPYALTELVELPELHDSRHVVLSPDGARVAYTMWSLVTEESSLHLVHLDQPGTATQVGRTTSILSGPVFTPDSQTVVYVQDLATSDGVGLFRSGVDAPGDQQLLYEYVSDEYWWGYVGFALSPTGGHLLAREVDPDRLFLVELGGSAVELTALGVDDSNWYVFTPDGAGVLFDQDGDLFHVEVDDPGTATRLNPLRGEHEWGVGVWRLSPDGTYAVVGGSLDGQPFNALFLDDPGVAHPLLEPGIGGVASFQISPDSQYVLAEVIPVGLSEGSSGLVLADPSAPGHGELLLEIPLREGEDELRLEGVGVSPDGTRVVVHADIDETQGLEGVWLDPEVPGEAHHLTDPGVLAQLFHWWFLPDG